MSSSTLYKTTNMATAALVTSLISAAAWITLPIGAVPVTLQTFVVVLAALVLTPGAALASMGLYLLMGAAGLPIFSGAHGGLGVIVGPTGGYLVGFAVGAFLGAFLHRQLRQRFGMLVADAGAALATLAIVYILGTAWLAQVAHMTTEQALAAGVAPFVLLDLAKIAAAVVVARAVRRATGVEASPTQEVPAA